MARPRKNGDSAIQEEGTEGVEAGEVVQMITGKQLKTLLKSGKSKQADIDELNESISTLKGEISAEVKKAVSKNHLDVTMFKIVKKLDAMTDEQLGYHVPNLLYMLDESGITARAQSAPPLQFEQTEGSEGNMPKPESVRAH